MTDRGPGTAFAVLPHAWADEATPRPAGELPYTISAPASVEELDFEPRPMVAWYSPRELFIAAFRAVVSGIFGAYADKRETMSLLAKPLVRDYRPHFERHGELWIDFVADLGDGWSPTYAIARLIAERELAFDGEGRGGADATAAVSRTRRGHVLIMGGDQVYPTASLAEYGDRLVGPYRSALPAVPYDDQAPHLYAVPGNHDWYDGLGSFFQVFCRGRWIGAWKTQQSRSYFAFRISERLWVWGIDIQLCANIDQPQLDYFDGIAAEMPEGSSIILCTAQPSWAYAEMNTWQERHAARREKDKEEVYNNLGHLEKTIVHRYGHDIAVALAGDAHNYTRYRDEASDQQRIVAGGGGASLFPTHDMPERLVLPEKFGGKCYRREAVFPDEHLSRRLAAKTIGFPLFRQNWGLALLMGSMYLLIAWVVQSVSKIRTAQVADATLLHDLADGPDLKAFIAILAHSPGSVAFLVLLLFGFIAFSAYASLPKKILHGTLHTLAHVALLFGLLTAFAMFNLGVLGLGVDTVPQVILFFFEMLVFGSLLGGFVFGAYLWLSNRFLHLHDDEILLGQSDPDYKHFLRLHVRRDGTITIYPVGVAKVPGKRGWSADSVRRTLTGWVFRPGASGSQAWFEPEGATMPTRARLIETPVTVSFRTEGGE